MAFCISYCNSICFKHHYALEDQNGHYNNKVNRISIIMAWYETYFLKQNTSSVAKHNRKTLQNVICRAACTKRLSTKMPHTHTGLFFLKLLSYDFIWLVLQLQPGSVTATEIQEKRSIRRLLALGSTQIEQKTHISACELISPTFLNMGHIPLLLFEHTRSAFLVRMHAWLLGESSLVPGVPICQLALPPTNQKFLRVLGNNPEKTSLFVLQRLLHLFHSID